jgi:putative ABC transport system permease protein
MFLPMLFRRQKGRLILSVAGIALGVALGYGVHLVNRAAVEDVAAAVRTLAGEADLEVRGARGGFAESVYAAVARIPGVELASPVLELDAGVAGGGRSVSTIRVVGVDILRAAALQPNLVMEDRYEMLAPDKVFLSASAADALRLGKGDELRLVVGQKTVPLSIAGVLPAASLHGNAVLTDIATAQWRLERLGELNRIDIRLKIRADRNKVLEQIQKLLPPGVHVSQLQTLEEASGYPSRSYRVNLNVLAMVALFTGGFLVFSAQALEVARRRGEHALLRVLGTTRAQIFRMVLAEAAALGAAGAAIGLALGYVLAIVAVKASGGDLGAGMFRDGIPQLHFSFLSTVLYFVSGIVIAVAGAVLPALDAARSPAARALKAGDEQLMFRRLSPAWPGLACIAFGAALAFLGPIGGVPVFGYAAIACILVGSIALMPWVSQKVFEFLPLPRQPGLALALAQLRAAPGKAAVSLAAIVASFSLMAAMAIMVSSFRQSVDGWLDTVLPAELYFRTTHAGDTGYLEPGFEEQVRALPQIARADFLRSGRILLDPARPPLVLIARDRAAKAFPMVGEQRPGNLWVSEAVADVYGISVSQRVIFPLNGKNHPFIVAGVFRDYARQHGAVLIERADYVALTGDRRVNDAALWLAPGVTPAQAMDAVRALFDKDASAGGAVLEMAAPGEIREASLRIFDRSFAITYAMEAVAVIVGLFGLSSSLGAMVLARRREFGMLRHLGLTRRQIAGMLAAEGGLLASLGAAAGLAAGAAISLVLIYVVNRQSFNWSMELHPPYLFLLLLMMILIGLAVLTALFSGKEAMGMGAVRAVREDW